MYWTLKAVLILCYCIAVQCTIFPTFNWISSNQEFQGNATLYVELFSQINILCPHPAMIVKRQRFTHSINKLYENIWLVDKIGYENCRLSNSKIKAKIHRPIGVCNQPTKLTYYTIAFEMFPTGFNSIKFKTGETYYFISTSNGHSNSLRKKAKGHCKTHNMRLRIYICRGRRDPICLAQRRKKPAICGR